MMEREVFNNSNESEDRIAELLGSLSRVEAPANFETLVRSRIARGVPATRFGWPELLLGLKFALPTIALLILGAFLIFSGSNAVDQAAVPTVEENIALNSQSAEPVPVTGPTAPERDTIAAAADISKPPAESVRTANRKAETEPISRDMTVLPEPTPVFPRGLNPNRKVDDLRGVSPRGSGIPVESILSMVGVSTNCDSAGCGVTGVQAKSIADRSGIQKGDRIDAIDDKPIKAGTVLEGTVSFKMLRILRGGQRLTIDFTVR